MHPKPRPDAPDVFFGNYLSCFDILNNIQGAAKIPSFDLLLCKLIIYYTNGFFRFTNRFYHLRKLLFVHRKGSIWSPDSPINNKMFFNDLSTKAGSHYRSSTAYRVV